MWLTYIFFKLKAKALGVLHMRHLLTKSQPVSCPEYVEPTTPSAIRDGLDAMHRKPSGLGEHSPNFDLVQSRLRLLILTF